MGKGKRFPIKRYQQVRQFGGKPYKLVDHFGNKWEARRLQKTIKAKGNLARIIKTKHGHEVWARKA